MADRIAPRRRLYRTLRRLGGRALRRVPLLRSLLLDQFDPRHPAAYRAWLRRHDRLTPADQAAIRAQVARLPHLVLTLLVPGDAGVAGLAMSLLGQLYPHWRLRIVGAAPAGLPADPRISHGETVSLAEDGFVGVLPADARLAPHALYVFAAELARQPETDLLYCDEDRLDGQDRRHAPLFKSGWSIDLLHGQEALGDLVLMRATALRRAGGIGALAAWHDRALRLGEIVPEARIRHLPWVLVHRRAAPGARPADAAAVQQHLARSGETAAVTALPGGMLRLRRPRPARPPLVSVIIPTRDAAALLARAAAGVLERTDWPALELIIADNGSSDPVALALLTRLAADPRVRVLRLPGPFNYAALNNRAAAQARGEILVLLNNDVDIIGADWLDELVAQAMRPEVGAVGAKLLYANGTLQHGGVALGVSGVAGHVELLAAGDAAGYGGRLAVVREVAAVTAACLALRRDVFDAVGGLDAEHLAVAYNDVDLCLRIRARGWRVLWTPFAEMFHLESASRPFDLAPAQVERYRREVAYMTRRWGAALLADPYYGANFSLRDGLYALGAPRREKPWRAGPATDGRAAARSAPVLAGVSSGD